MSMSAKRSIPHNRITVNDNAFEQVLAVLRSGQLTMGPVCAELERRLVDFIGCADAVVVNSGTSALHLALLSLKRADDDEVILPSYVCISVYNAVIMAGMRPRLVDVTPDTGNIDPVSASHAVTGHTRAIIVPHLFGMPAAMDELLALDIPLIEDVTQAVGAGYHGRAVGTLGTLGVMSMYATKMLNGAEGGAMLCQTTEQAAHFRRVRDYMEPLAQWEMQYNYRLSDVHAALAVAHVECLKDTIARRHAIATRYDELLEPFDGICRVSYPDYIQPAYYRYLVRVPESIGAASVRASMAQQGIGTGDGVHSPIHSNIGLADSGFPSTARWHHTAVSLPMYPTLKDNDCVVIAEALRHAMRTAK